MSISLKTHKMLWGRSGNRCSMPDCRKILVIESAGIDNESLIGEECHIIAKKQDGPRGKSDLSLEERNEYKNLILLCRVHHKIIDDQPNKYTVDKLYLIKENHEKWVRESLREYDDLKQRDDETYASYIETWIEKADIDNWKNWSLSVLSAGEPELPIETDQKLQELKVWLLSRVWPKRYPALDKAFENFSSVLCDFLYVFHKHSFEVNEMFFCTKKFYKIHEWDEKRYNLLLKEYNFHVYLVEDLCLELTRAANYLCDKVREFIDPFFRLTEGVILIEGGPYINLSYKYYRVEYRDAERMDIPYLGLQQFKIDRESRDIHFGVGKDINDPKFKQWYNKME